MSNVNAGPWHCKAFRNNYLAAFLAIWTILYTAPSAHAQVDTTRELPKRNASYADKHLQADSSLRMPLDTPKLRSTWRSIQFKGNNPYYWDGSKWNAFAATSPGGGSSAIVKGTPPALGYFRTSDSTLVSAINGTGGLFYKSNWLQVDSGKLKVTMPTSLATSDTAFVIRTAGKPPTLYMLPTENGAANAGQFVIDHYPCGLCPEVGFRFRGDDLGFVRNEIINMYGGTSSSAGVGMDIVMNAWGQHFQLFSGGGANFFAPNGSLIRSTKYLRLHGDSTAAGVQISVGGLGAPGTNEIARFTSTGLGVGTTSPQKKFHVNGTVRLEALGTATNDTSNYKPLGRNTTTGDILPMTYWPGSGGAAPSPTGWDDMLAVGQQQTTTRTADMNGNTLNFDQVGNWNVSTISASGKYNSILFAIPNTDFQNANSIAGSDAGFHSNVNTQSGNRSAQTWLTAYGGTGNRSTIGAWERGIELLSDSIRARAGIVNIDSAVVKIQPKVNVYDTIFRIRDAVNDGFYVARKNDADYFRAYARNFTSTNLSTVNGVGTVFDANAGSVVQFQNNVKQVGNQQRLFLKRSYAFTDADPNNSIGVDIDNDTLSTGVYPFLDSSKFNPLVVKFTNHSGATTEKLKVRADGQTIINGGLSWNIRTITSNATADPNDGTILVDASGGNVTVTLPAAASFPGRILVVKKIDSSGNSVTIDGNASETIDGSLTKSTSTQWTTYMVQSNGTSIFIIN